MKYIKAIESELVKDWQDAEDKANTLKEEIINRIDYILNFWFKTYDAELDHWHFGDKWEKTDNINYFINDDVISSIYTEVINYPDNNMIFVDKDGHEYSWQSEIPIRWLYDDGFEQEIIQGKITYEAKENKRKAKRKIIAAKKKAKYDKLVEQAKKKLSKEELAAIRRKL